MNRFSFSVIGWFIAIFSSIWGGGVNAQIVPDQSLPNNSVVSDELEITGGTTAGKNLFHSFQEFSVPTGETAFFNHNLGIENILTRVTGGSISEINGLIRSLGDANLFLINPNGIVFGENAALDIGGSFIGSSANSIQFADGSQFSAVNPQAEPLLTVSIPLGLQYGTNPGDIAVLGLGNNLRVDEFTFTIDRSDRPEGLAVKDGHTLALIGGNVSLSGGNLTARNGRVAISSIADEGLVSLNADDLGWNFDYEQVATLGNIGLFEAASVEVSGTGGGEAFLRGNNVLLGDGSAILANTLGNESGKVLDIVADRSVQLIGLSTDNFFPTQLSTDVDLGAAGKGGDLSIETGYLLVADGGQINSNTFGFGDGGNLSITASQIEIAGFSGLFAQVGFESTGNGGNLDISTSDLLVTDGGQISTSTFGLGDGGNLSITASQVEVIGVLDAFPSALFADTIAFGKGGNINIFTDYLLVADGGQISTSTFGFGDGGNLAISASKIELIGGAAEVGASGIFASVNFTEIENAAMIEIIEATGTGGNISIQSDTLTISQGAQIAALTDTLGNAGRISIESQEINIIGTSPIGFPGGIFAVADFSQGAGGDIIINTETLNIQAGGQIATSTSGFGDGGDLIIFASDSINISGAVDAGSSGLFASAIANDGSGGNILIETNLLSISDSATISVSNFPSSLNSPLPPGEGAAGNITIISSTIALNEQATVTADTFTGDRGNITLQTDLLSLRRASTISTNAQETATGGNIIIDASDGFIVAIPQENSDITANAVFGQGGRVDISALEIFGIQPRNSLTPFSDITASSEFGISGSVVLNTQDLNPTEDSPRLSNNLNPPQLEQGCQIADSNSSFLSLGKGGVIPQPSDALTGEEIIGDVQLPIEWKKEKEGESVVEAQGWIINQEGKIALVAQIPQNNFLSGCKF